MDRLQHIWRGQLLVGRRDIGQATIWTAHNSYLPPIGSNLKMTYITEYADLWTKVLEAEPTLLSEESYTKINGKYVSLFTITSPTPEFLQLTEELNGSKNARMILSSLPKDDMEVTLIPQCRETKRLGMWTPPKDLQPFLYFVLISKTSPRRSMQNHKKQYIHIMSKRQKTSTPQDGVKTRDLRSIIEARKSKGGVKGSEEHKRKESKHHDKDYDKGSRKNDKEGKKEKKKREVKEDGGDRKRKGEKEKISKETKDKGKKIVEMLNEDSDKHPNTRVKDFAEEKKTQKSVKTIGSLFKSVVKTEQTMMPDVTEVVDSQKVSSKGKPVDKKNLLDTQKLNKIFSSKNKERPDLIKPSMLKRSAKEKVDQALKTVTPDLIASSEFQDKLPMANLKDSSISATSENALSTEGCKSEISIKDDVKAKDIHKKKTSVKNTLKGTIRKLTSAQLENDKQPSEKKAEELTEKGEEVTVSPKNKDIGSEHALSSDILEKSEEEKIEGQAEKKSLSSSHEFFVSNSSNHIYEEIKDQNVLELELKKKKGTGRENSNAENNGRNNVLEALDNFKEFITTKFSNKRKSECTEKALQELQSPSKKPRVSSLAECPEQSILNTPQASCYPNIFKNIKWKYKKAIVSKHHESESNDGLNNIKMEDIPDWDNKPSCKYPGALDLSVSGSEVGLPFRRMMQDGCPGNEMEPVDLSFHESRSFTALGDVKMNTSKADECSLAETVSWKGPAQAELDLPNPAYTPGGKQYILDMFLHSVQREDVKDIVLEIPAMSTLDSIPVKDNNLSGNIPLNFGDKDSKKFDLNNDYIDSDATFICHEDVKSHDIPNLFCHQSQEPMPCDEIPPVNNDHLVACDQYCLPYQDGILNQILLPDQFSLLNESSGRPSSNLLYIDDQMSSASQKDCYNHALDLRKDNSDKPSVPDQPLDSKMLLANEQPSLIMQPLSPGNGFMNAVAHSSPKLIKDKEFDQFENKTPLYHPLPDLPPLKRLSDLAKNKRSSSNQEQIIPVSGTESISYSPEIGIHGITTTDNSPEVGIHAITTTDNSPEVGIHTITTTDNSKSPLTRESLPSPKTSIKSSGMMAFQNIDNFKVEDQPQLESLKENIPSNECFDTMNLSNSNMQNVQHSEDASNFVLEEAMSGLQCHHDISPACIKSDSELYATYVLNNPTKSHDLHPEHINSPKSGIKANTNTLVTESPAYEIAYVHQQLQKKIKMWQDNTDSKFNAHQTQGIKALSDFIQQQKNIPPELKKGMATPEDGTAKTCTLMKMVVLKNLLHQNEKKMFADSQTGVRIIAVECKSENCIDSNACSQYSNTCPQVLQSPQMSKESSPVALENLKEESQRQRNMIKSRKLLLELNEPDFISWEDPMEGISTSEFQASKYINLFNASNDDILKMKYFCRAQQMTYITLDDLAEKGGYILINQSAIANFLLAPDLITWSHLPNVKFGVYTSLSALHNNKVTPVLTSKWLMLLHHTAMVDPLLVKILERALDEKKCGKPHYLQIVIPMVTLKICYCCIVNSKKEDRKERLTCKILQSNIIFLIKCLGRGVVKVISGDSKWGKLGPEASVNLHLQSLKVLHINFGLTQRHVSLLVGENVQSVSTNNQYYKVQTVGNVAKII